MAGDSTVVVALEDMGTATVVAVEGARVAMDMDQDTTADATRVILLHVLDRHPVMGAILGMSGQCMSLSETSDEVEALFQAAEETMRAEFGALGRPQPVVRREVAEGDIAAAIGQVARDYGAGVVVLGARRPRAFGRLVHPDVQARLASQTPCRIHIAALQESASPAPMPAPASTPAGPPTYGSA